MKEEQHERPCFTISIVAQMVEMHPQTIRHYERMGLLEPSRSEGNIRLFSMKDVERLNKIQNFTKDMGVNLAGVEVILKLLDQMEAMKEQMEAEVNEIKSRWEKEMRMLQEEEKE